LFDSIASEPPRRMQALPLLMLRRGRLDRHIGPALVDHAEHADRHAHLAHAMPLGCCFMPMISPIDVGHGGQLLAALGAGFQHLGAELQAIHHGLGQAGGAGALQ
jgi:hypothetical protein